MLHKSPVLTDERNDVRHRPERDKIEMRFEIEAIVRSSLKQSVTKFKNDPDAAQIMKCGTGVGLWVHDHAIGQGGFRFVVIEHDYIHPAFPKITNFLGRRCTAVDRDQKLRLMFFEAAFDAFAAQAVA